MIALNRIEEPVGLVVSVDELKTARRISTDDHDAMLEELILAATGEVESGTGRSLLTQKWRLVVDSFGREIPLPRAPLVSVEEIGYIDLNGDTQVVDSSVYEVSVSSEPGRVLLLPGQMWPSRSAARYAEPVWIEFTAGFGAADDVPVAFKRMVTVLAGHWYDNGDVSGVPEFMQAHMLSKRIFWSC